MRILSAAALLLLLLSATPASATPCDKLSGAEQKVARKLFKGVHPHDCCDETLDRCLKAKKVCRLAHRLRDDICRRTKKGEEPKQIKAALARRVKSMVNLGKRARFSLKGLHPAGNPDGPVQVIVYACARCPYCRKVVPELYNLVTSGPLKGQIALYFRPFPIRGHAGSMEGGLGFIVAQSWSKLWPYVLETYKGFDHFSAAALPRWGAAVGIPAAEFKKGMKESLARSILVATKKEGLRNGVDATPTIFINGRKYYGELEREVLADVLGEAVDRAEKRIYE